jgi:hypothetical protein
MTEQQPDERWDAILGMLKSMASLDFSRTLPISDEADNMDAVASGLNMLSEELHANVVERSTLEKIVKELEVANQELQAFSDVLAHDLRNPLLDRDQLQPPAPRNPRRLARWPASRRLTAYFLRGPAHDAYHRRPSRLR